MAATVHVLDPRPTPIAGFLRIGRTGHKQRAAYHASGRFPYRRVVFEAAYLKKAIDGARSRLSRLRDALGDLHLHDEAPSRSRPTVFRGGGGTITAMLGG